MSLHEAKQFVAQFIKGDYTPEEYAAFLRWLKGANIDELNEIADEHESNHDQWVAMAATPPADWVSRLEQKLDGVGEEGGGLVRRFSPERWVRRRTWIAAASVIVLLSAGVYVFVREERKVPQVGAEAVKVSLNTYSNPRGGDQKELILADGSKVWLNAASTLKFPSQFDGPERVVELSGEAFFEVTNNSNKPFRVKIKDAEVDVLGTHFDVMAYEDETISRTTLIEGSVRVESGAQPVVLKPGEQAEIPYPSPGVVPTVKVVPVVNMDAVLAWKNGFFQFDNEDVKTVMKAIGRAYDVDVQFDANVPNGRITGVFSRQKSLTETLNLIEHIKSLGIHFKIDGKSVRVTL
jgi:ferric-dicitrate binding protein FerR (iron transport regulator)